MNLESHFSKFRNKIVGIDTSFNSPFGNQKLIYADWIASGRLYKPIEEKMINTFYPMVGNTHSESSITGCLMTNAYHKAQKIIKEHVNASADDIIISAGFGMTAVVNKLQRILNLKVPEKYKGSFKKGTLDFHIPIQYSDMAIRKFFRKVEKMKWFENTLFVITADHSNHAWHPEYKTFIGDFSIPILFYLPENKGFKGIDSTIVAQ